MKEPGNEVDGNVDHKILRARAVYGVSVDSASEAQYRLVASTSPLSRDLSGDTVKSAVLV